MSRFLSALADQYILYCVPLLVYQSSRSIAAAGLAYAIEWLPRVLSLFFSGSVVDRVGPRRVCLTSDSARAALAAGALLLPQVTVEPQFWVYGILGGVMGLFFETSFLAFDVAITRASTPATLTRNQSVIQGIEQATTIIGPAAAVALSAFLGLHGLFSVAAALFTASFLVVRFATPAETSAAATEHSPSFLRQVARGFRFLFTSPVLRSVVISAFGFNLALGAVLSSTPGYLQSAFGLSPSSFGVVATLGGIAAVLVCVVTPGLARCFGLGPVGIVAVTGGLVACVLFATAPSLPVYAAGFMLLTGADGTLTIFARTTRARVTPTDRLGAVTSAMMLVLLAAFPLSGLLVGLAAESAGIPALFAALAVLLGILLLGPARSGGAFSRRATPEVAA